MCIELYNIPVFSVFYTLFGLLSLQIFEVPRMKFTEIPRRLQALLVPPDPLVVHHLIKYAVVCHHCMDLYSVRSGGGG